MANVVALGARVFLHSAPDTPNPQPDGSVVLGFQLFGVLGDGSVIMAREANGLSVERVPDGVSELAGMIETGLHSPTLDPAGRSALFGNLVEELARAEIRTDLETLMHLPFWVEPTEEVRALIDGG